MMPGLCCDQYISPLMTDDRVAQLQLVSPGHKMVNRDEPRHYHTFPTPGPINNFLQDQSLNRGTERVRAAGHMMFYQSIVQCVISHIGIAIMTLTIKYWLVKPSLLYIGGKYFVIVLSTIFAASLPCCK